jgi:type II secretory pathway pseudopilin PulG
VKRNNRHRAFTLIELAVACAITALLMAGVLAVVTAMTRDRQRVAVANLIQPQSQAAILELLRLDLSCATDIQPGAGSVTLHTFSSLNAKNNSPLDRPSLVQYRIIQESGTGCLIRRQQLTDDPIAPPSENVVAFGVQGISVQATQIPSSHQVRVQVDFGDTTKNIQQTILMN